MRPGEEADTVDKWLIFPGAVCVITGATRGIGKSAAVSFARRGAHLVLVGRSTEHSPNRGGLPGTLESVAGELQALGAGVTTVAANLSQPDDVQRVADATTKQFGRCDVLVNNAAVSFLGMFLDVAPRTLAGGSRCQSARTRKPHPCLPAGDDRAWRRPHSQRQLRRGRYP